MEQQKDYPETLEEAVLMLCKDAGADIHLSLDFPLSPALIPPNPDLFSDVFEGPQHYGTFNDVLDYYIFQERWFGHGNTAMIRPVDSASDAAKLRAEVNMKSCRQAHGVY